MKNHQNDKPSFTVHLNGKRICRAGICGDGDLCATLRIGNIKTRDSIIHNYVTCSILGLFDKKFHTWFHDENLKIGDEITIKIEKLDSIDEPIEIKDVDKDMLEMEKSLNKPWWKFWG